MTSARQEARTANFLVQAKSDRLLVRNVAVACETLRTKFAEQWLDETAPRHWDVPCLVAIHRSRDGYVAAVGPAGANTSGSSVITAEQGQIIGRRIDLLANKDDEVTALAHELTHVVLADRFEPGKLPLWANEGIAMLADTTQKRDLHLRDCHLAVTNGNDFHLHSLVALRRFIDPRQLAPFYGQSLSLTQFLLTLSDEGQFATFLELATIRGYDFALRECYAINGLEELDRQWRSYRAKRLAETETTATDGKTK